jgi:hypothetical protein
LAAYLSVAPQESQAELPQMVDHTVDLSRIHLAAEHFQPQPGAEGIEHRSRQGIGQKCSRCRGGAVPTEPARHQERDRGSNQKAGENTDEGAERETKAGARRRRVLANHPNELQAKPAAESL